MKPSTLRARIAPIVLLPEGRVIRRRKRVVAPKVLLPVEPGVSRAVYRASTAAPPKPPVFCLVQSGRHRIMCVYSDETDLAERTIHHLGIVARVCSRDRGR